MQNVPGNKSNDIDTQVKSINVFLVNASHPKANSNFAGA